MRLVREPVPVAGRYVLLIDDSRRRASSCFGSSGSCGLRQCDDDPGGQADCGLCFCAVHGCLSELAGRADWSRTRPDVFGLDWIAVRCVCTSWMSDMSECTRVCKAEAKSELRARLSMFQGSFGSALSS